MIVDASIAIKWILDEADSGAAIELLDRRDLTAPDFVLVEVADVVWKAWRRGALTDVQAQTALEQLPTLFGHLRPFERLLSTALRIAIELDHPVYDCLYIAAAIEDNDRLITTDRRLLERMAGTAYVALVSPLEG